MIGGSVPEVVAFMEQALGHTLDAEEIGSEIYASVLANIGRGISAMEGAIDLVNSLRGTRPLGVASNGSLATVRASLAGAGFSDVFDVVVALGPSTLPKPAPDLYLEACSLLGVETSDAIAIEDSYRGATAAKRAGMSVVGVGKAPRLEESSDFVVEHLSDVRLAQLLGVATTR
jgi:HAD superfamily hydrolase (TIGR01509 family)